MTGLSKFIRNDLFKYYFGIDNFSDSISKLSKFNILLHKLSEKTNQKFFLYS